MPSATMGASRPLIISPPVSAFTPADLALTAYFKEYSGSSPWVGTASAGTSGTHNATEGTNPPSAGTALNGYSTAQYDGSNDRLTLDGTTPSYFGAAALSAFALVYVDNTNERVIFETHNAYAPLYVSSGVVYFRPYGAGTNCSRAISIGAWALVTLRYTGSNVEIGVNEVPGAFGGSSVTAFSSAMGLSGEILRMGDGAHGHYFGRMMEVGISDTALTDQNFLDIKTYCNTRYSLSL